MSLVMCSTKQAGHGSKPHEESEECDYPHYVAPSAPIPSMTEAETLDPREAVTK